MKVVFDSGPLITACKFEVEQKLVIDYLLTYCSILIASSVEEEVAVLGSNYSDGVAAGERIEGGKIKVVNVSHRRWNEHLHGYALGKGEQDSIELCGQEANVQAFVTDDHLAFIAASRLGLDVWMLPDLVLALRKRENLANREAKAILEVIRPRYRAGVIEYSLEKLREVKNAQSGSSD